MQAVVLVVSTVVSLTCTFGKAVTRWLSTEESTVQVCDATKA